MTYLIFAAAFAVIACLFGYLVWKQHSDYPIEVKGKVMRYTKNKVADKYYYTFEARSNGYHILYDQKGYKEKNFKEHDRVIVHMNREGTECISSVSLIPFVVCLFSAVLAMTMIIGYFADIKNQREQEQAEGSLYQETGRYIITDSDVLFAGDNIGLIRLSGEDGEGISTGDEGAVFFIGTPKKDDGDKLSYVTPFTANVYEDGTPDDIDDFYLNKTEELGYTINKDVTEYVAPVYEEEHEHDEGEFADDESVDVIADVVDKVEPDVVETVDSGVESNNEVDNTIQAEETVIENTEANTSNQSKKTDSTTTE